MKTSKKLLALLLCLTMCASLFAGFAMAETTPPIECNLVCIGDSTSQGYYLDDYSDEQLGAYDDSSKEAYPFQFQQYLEWKLKDNYKSEVKVNLRNMTFQAVRTDELRAVLDPSFKTDIADKKNSGNGDTFLNSRMRGYENFFNKNWNDLYAKGYLSNPAPENNGVPLATQAFRESIAQADIITLDVTMNNFGTYLTERLMAVLGINDISEYSESVDELGPGLDFDVAAVEAKVKGLIAQYLPADLGLPTDMIDGLLDMFVYCYCDFRVNFAEDVRLIRELNPDAKLIVFGAYNGMNGLTCDIAGLNVEFGELWGAYMGLVNTFITTTCKYNDQYSYVDCTPGVRVFTEALAKGEVYERYMLGMINNDAILPSVKSIAQQYVDGVKAQTGGMEPDAILAMISDAEAQALLNPAFEGNIEAARAWLVENNAQYAAAVASKNMLESILPSYIRARELLGSSKNAKGELVGTEFIRQRLIDAAALSPIDFMSIFDTLGGGADMNQVVLNALFNEEPTVAEMSMLHIYVRFLSCRGIGTHPDDLGCAQKTEYLIKAYEKDATADTETEGAIIDLGKHTFSAIFGAIKNPLMEKIASIMDNFWNAMDQFFNFLLKPVADFIDLLPFC